MPHSAKDIFDHSIKRAHHFLTLYDLLNDTRHRSGRSDWITKFKNLMHWPQYTNIVRVDGKDKNSILIFKEIEGIDRKHFSHNYVSELLRSALVASVSSLDRYVHDLIVNHCWPLLANKEEDIPNGLKKISLSVLTTKRIIEKVRKNTTSRPGTIVKAEIQKLLHRDYTFQSPSNIDKATNILGIKDFWRKLSDKMPGSPPNSEVRKELKEIARRRNQIVHESDLILKTKSKAITARKIDRQKARDAVNFIIDFVTAFDELAQEEL